MDTGGQLKDDVNLLENASTALETLAIVLPTIFLTYLTTILSTKGDLDIHTRFLLEIFVLVFPNILIMTILSSYIYEVIATLLFLAMCLTYTHSSYKQNFSFENYTQCYFTRARMKIERSIDWDSEREAYENDCGRENEQKNKNINELSPVNEYKQIERSKVTPKTPRTKFVTNIRATTNLLTAIAILAVDFKIFPERFAKTTTYGFSLMDLGVGLFVYSNGIVAPEIRGKNTSPLAALKSSLPLFVLGVGRLLATSSVRYKVPVMEYGVHWNFFITLGFTRVLSSFILYLVPVKFALFIGVFLLSTHEVFLQLGLANFVFDATVTRDNIVTANKEGLVSCLGYVGLYFLAVSFGLILHEKSADPPAFSIARKLQLNTFFLAVVTYCFNEIFEVSRRLANIGYCFWITFFGVFFTNLFYLNEKAQDWFYTYAGGFHVPTLFQAINYNGLVFFLVANVLTGLVNITVETSDVGPVASVSILLFYMTVVCVITFVLFIHKVKLTIK